MQTANCCLDYEIYLHTIEVYEFFTRSNQSNEMKSSLNKWFKVKDSNSFYFKMRNSENRLLFVSFYLSNRIEWNN